MVAIKLELAVNQDDPGADRFAIAYQKVPGVGWVYQAISPGFDSETVASEIADLLTAEFPGNDPAV